MPKIKLAVIISTWNRLELLKQTLESLKQNSDSQLEIIIVDDNSTDGTKEFLEAGKGCPGFYFYHFDYQATIAEVKNKGFELAPKTEYIYFSDDDVYFEPHWDSKLIGVLQEFGDIGVVGGRKHPHHRLFEVREFGDSKVLICEQQAGYSLMLRRTDYLAINGFDASEQTRMGGEDSLLNDMIKEKALLIAAVEPAVIIHCGMTNWQKLVAADIHEMRTIQALRPEIKFQ